MSMQYSHNGPFFTLGVTPVLESMHRSVDELANEGAIQVQQQLTSGHGVLTGEYRSGIHGQMTDSMHGGVSDGNAIIGSWLEGTNSRNHSTRFKGYGIFRKALQRLNGLAQNTANKNVATGVSRLNT